MTVVEPGHWPTFEQCLLFSDAFDFQYGAVILRLKEGLDVSHIQGQGNPHSLTLSLCPFLKFTTP